MNMKNHTRIDLVEGGSIFKQGDHVQLGFTPRDYAGNVVDLSGKTIDVTIWSRKGIMYEGAATWDAVNQLIRVTITQLLEHGQFNIEFTATSSTDASYRQKFPSGQYDGKITIEPSADNMDVVGVKITTVTELRSEMQGVREELDVIVKRETDSDAMSAQATVSVDGTVYPTLKARLDAEKQETAGKLADKAYKLTEFKEQGVAFDTSEDNHVSWLHCNVSYDPSDDSFFVVYNAQPTHSVTQSKTFARKKYRNGAFSEKIVIASRLAEGISAKCQSSGIAPNGDYLAVVAHIDPANWMNVLGTYVYRSTDKGLTWDTGTKIGVEGEPIIGYSGDISGFLTLSTGRILLWGWDLTKKSFAVYSDDNGVNWFNATIEGNPYNVTEPTFIELSDGTIIGYARDDVSDGSDHINIPKPAWFLKSTTGGESWEMPVKSTTILDMSNNNCAFVKHGDLVEIIYGSRFLHKDGFGSIYQAITSQEELKNDNWSQPVRIARVNGIPSNLSGDGDSGYYGAATAKDGTSLVFYYNGTKTASKVYYLKGNFNTPVFSEKEDFSFKSIENKIPGELNLGDYSGTKGRLKAKRKVNGINYFGDIAVASTGELFISLMSEANGVETSLGVIKIAPDGKVIVNNFTSPSLSATRKYGEVDRAFRINTNNSIHGLLQLVNNLDNSILAELGLSPGTLYPTTDKAISLGTTTNRFGSGYFTGVVGSMAVPTDLRPTTDLVIGATMFDRTLNKPIWVKQVTPSIIWVDANGTTV